MNFQFTFVLEALSTFLTNLNNTIYQRYIHYVFDIWFFFSNENVIASSQSQLHVNIEKQNLTLLEN